MTAALLYGDHRGRELAWSMVAPFMRPKDREDAAKWLHTPGTRHNYYHGVPVDAAMPPSAIFNRLFLFTGLGRLAGGGLERWSDVHAGLPDKAGIAPDERRLMRV